MFIMESQEISKRLRILMLDPLNGESLTTQNWSFRYRTAAEIAILDRRFARVLWSRFDSSKNQLNEAYLCPPGFIVGNISRAI